ncbi:MAG: MG2 domain-containing protein [Gammaproteobacteria bacterium]|nr:MG2 domain-containing protein [Gammaproteobacteria bacterium]
MTQKRLLLIFFGIIASGLYAQTGSPDKPLRVSAVYPTGIEVALGDSITIEFNQNMISLGKSMFTDDTVPITIEPALECEWNWVKLNTLKCDLPIDSTLAPSTRYQVTVLPKIVAPRGQRLEQEHVHVFETITPAIRYASLVSWMSPSQPILQVTFNQELTREQILGKVFLIDEASGKEIPTTVKLYSREVRRRLSNDYFGRMKHYLYRNRFTRGDTAMVLPDENLSFSSKVSVVLSPGVAGTEGHLKSTKRSVFETSITTFAEKFRLLGLHCRDVHGEPLFIEIDQTLDTLCAVQRSISLEFSSVFVDIRLSDYVNLQPYADIDINPRFGPRFFSSRYDHRGTLAPDTDYLIAVESEPAHSIEGGKQSSLSVLKDGFGRPLSGPNQIAFKTAHHFPKISSIQNPLVVDSADSYDPVLSLQNVEDVSITYDLFDEQGVVQKQTRQLPNLDPIDVVHKQPLGLRSALRSASGVMYGTIVGNAKFEYRQEKLNQNFFAQATPYSVFFKVGALSTLAWVVNFQTGEPVANAKVEFFKSVSTQLDKSDSPIMTGITDTAGIVVLPGFETFDPNWDLVDHNMREKCGEDRECTAYFLHVEADQGQALLPLVDDYQFGWSKVVLSDYVDHWATTSQKLYQPGDTVHIKGYVRRDRHEHRTILQDGHFALCVSGPREREYEINNITVNEFGAYDATLKLNKKTPLGEYKIVLIYAPDSSLAEVCRVAVRDYDEIDVYSALELAWSDSVQFEDEENNVQFLQFRVGGEFEVHEFKTNPIRVSQTFDAKDYERDDSMIITTTAELHAGDPYANAPGRVHVSITSKTPPVKVDDDYEYKFGDGSYGSDRTYWREVNIVFDEFELDSKGFNEYTIESLTSNFYYGEITVETAVASDRGKYVAVSSSVPYFGVDQFVGIRRPADSNYWYPINRLIPVGEPWPINVVVVSKDNAIVPDKAVSITAYQRGKQRSNGSYSWYRVFDCEVISTEQVESCDFTPQTKGYFKIQAKIIDSKGYPHQSEIHVSASESKFEREERVELELHCDSHDVAVDEVVKCEVKNYFDSTPVLVTIERAGIVDQWITELNPRKPVIEFSVAETYAPHFKLSVIAIARLDAGDQKYTDFYRFASARFELEDSRLLPLEVSVSSDKSTYSPRDTVKLAIKGETTTPVEYAVAVIDEALMDLSQAGEEYYDPTQKRWSVRTDLVQTFGLIHLLKTSVRKLVKRSSETISGVINRVASMEEIVATGSRLPAPGELKSFQKMTDSKTRRVNKFIAYWNPSVIATDEPAELEFVLPDNLTSWKVVVMAASTDDRFGFASTTFNSVKDTEIRTVSPNVVTEGDTFHVGASIYNRANRERNLLVELSADGLLADTINSEFRERIRFDPQERKVVTIPLVAGELPVDFQNLRQTGEIRFVARVRDRRDHDALDVRIPVRTSRFPVSSVVYGALAGDLTSIPIEVPEKLVDQTGELNLSLTTEEKVNFDGVFQYVRDYPYFCWEQHLTKAVLALHYLRLEAEGDKHGVEWHEAQEIISQLLAAAVDHQAPNGGMAFFTPRDDAARPYLSAYTAIVFAWLAEAGYEIPRKVNEKLIGYLKEYLASDLTDEYGWPSEQNSTVLSGYQATIGSLLLHSLSISGELGVAELDVYSEQIHQLHLFGLSHYLLAALKVDPTLPLIDKIFTRIMNHRSLVDGAVEFREKAVPLAYVRMLHSDTRSLCSVLEALTLMSEKTTQGIDIGELKELANAVRYARDNLPRWMSTQDNVFCTNAMLAYSDFVGDSFDEIFANVDLRSKDTGEVTRIADAWQFNADTTKLQTRFSLKPQLLGTNGTIDIGRQGEGIAFYNVKLSYLSKADNDLNRFSGFEIHREYVVLRGQETSIVNPGDSVERGDIIYVNLYLNNKSDRFFVMVDDTVPGGIEPVNFALGTESRFMQSQDVDDILLSSKFYEDFRLARRVWADYTISNVIWDLFDIRGFRHRELGLKNVRYFAEELERGKYHLQWIGQVITPGEFTVIPTHVEEMYRPVMFGKSEPWTLIVEP